MTRRHFPCLVLIAFFLAVAAGQAEAVIAEEEALKILALLQGAYPDQAMELTGQPDGAWHIKIGGRAIILDDGAARSGKDLQNSPSLMDTLAIPYPAGEGGRSPEEGSDPGRARNLDFLRELYGADRGEVEQMLVKVDFLGSEVSFNQRHGAAEALQRVAQRLEDACQDDPSLKDWLMPVGGHYFWRNIEGTDRLSAHSFGIAIDLNPDKGIYWKWKPGAKLLEFTRHNFPQAIVDAFESQGFVWGGKWWHFDYMHFEYRPEMLNRQKEK